MLFRSARELSDELEGCDVSAVSASSTRNRTVETSFLNGRPRRLSSVGNKEVLNALRTIVNRYEREDKYGAVMYEWRQIAVSVDRILFWIFLVGTLSSTIIVLVIIPLTK